MASLGLPGLAGFWGEFPAILSAFTPAQGLHQYLGLFRGYMVVASVGTVLAAGYLLWMYQRTAFGVPQAEFEHAHIHDVHVPEWIAWVPMLLLIVALGVFPHLIFRVDRRRRAPGDPHDHPGGPGRGRLTRPCSPPSTSAGLLAAVTTFKAPYFDYHALAPEIVLTAVIVVVLLVDLVVDETHKYLVTQLAGFGVLGLGRADRDPGRQRDQRPSRGRCSAAPTSSTSFSLVLKALFLGTGYVVLLMSTNYIEEGDYYEGEFSFLLLCSLLGMVVMASSRDLITDLHRPRAALHPRLPAGRVAQARPASPTRRRSSTTCSGCWPPA